MRRLSFALACAALALAAARPAAAGCTAGAMITINDTPKWIWITIYDLGKTTHLDYGWVAPLNRRVWQSGRYNCLSWYHVRAEVKDWEGGAAQDGPNISDTEVETYQQFTVWLKTNVKIAIPSMSRDMWFYESKNFWWQTDGSNPTPAETLERHALALVNQSPYAVEYHVKWYDPAPELVVCVPPNGNGTLQVPVRQTSPTAQAIAVLGAGCSAPSAVPPLPMSFLPKAFVWNMKNAVVNPASSPRMAALSLASVPVTGPTPKLTYSAKAAVAKHGPKPALHFLNSSPYIVEFAWDKGSKCVAPGAEEKAPVPAGTYTVTVGTKTNCAAGVPRLGDTQVTAAVAEDAGARVTFTAGLTTSDL